MGKTRFEVYIKIVNARTKLGQQALAVTLIIRGLIATKESPLTDYRLVLQNVDRVYFTMTNVVRRESDKTFESQFL